MKNRLKSLDYITVAKYLTLFLFFLLFNNLEKEPSVYSIAILSSALCQGSSVIFAPLLFLLSFLCCGQVGLLAPASISAIILIIIVCVYKKFGTPIKYELLAYVALSLVGYVILGNTALETSIEKRILSSLLSIGLCFFCITAGKAVSEKGLKFKLGFEEFASVALTVAVTGLGVCNLLSPIVWKGLSVFIMLIICYLYRTGIATIVSAVLGLSLSVYYSDLNYVATYLIWAVVAESLNPVSRHVSAIALVISDYAIQVIFSVYPTYGLAEFLPMILGSAVFCAIPLKPLRALKEKLYSFREKHLVRQSINRNRIMLAGKLYDLSGVFTEIANAFSLFNHNQLPQEKIKENLINQIYSACKECEYCQRCKEYQKGFREGVCKMTDIGFAKGKLSLIDLPKEVSGVCLKPQNVLFMTNKLLSDYRSYALDKKNLENGRNLIASEALGVAEILNGLALETGAILKFQNRLERALSLEFFKNGILINELLIFGEEDRLSVSLIVVMKEFSISVISSIISKTLGVEMTLIEQAEVSEGKCYLSFKKSVDYDAVFGISRAVKDGSPASGDTHAVSRINDGKFLIALSDGMGSGDNAQIISSASLSLIESFYKAGLKSQLILSTVNKLLAINTEESFTALDISIVDLKDCSADFIKYGSPYGFIVGDNGVKIVEGNSLPLGIIDELKPSVCHTELNNGDMIVLLTDGISDAFGSSGEVIDYLRGVPAKNPQSLADGILSHALKLSGGEKKDDMTVLAVRVYKR